MDISSALTNVGVFAGAFTFGTLLCLPNTLENFIYISALLSSAFVLFTTSLFAAIGVRIILRKNAPDEVPSLLKTGIVVVHIALVGCLLIAGFIVLNLVLININQKVIGVIGIILLFLNAVWIVCIWYIESTGGLEDIMRDQALNHQEDANEHEKSISSPVVHIRTI